MCFTFSFGECLIINILATRSLPIMFFIFPNTNYMEVVPSQWSQSWCNINSRKKVSTCSTFSVTMERSIFAISVDAISTGAGRAHIFNLFKVYLLIRQHIIQVWHPNGTIYVGASRLKTGLETNEGSTNKTSARLRLEIIKQVKVDKLRKKTEENIF